MGIVVEELVAKVQADTSDYEAGMARVQATSDRTSSAAANSLARGSRIVALGVAGMAGLAIKSAADYESSMKVLGAVTNATADDMKELSKMAIALGQDAKLPGTSAKDAADAMTLLAKAGFNVQQSMGAARGVLQLSAAAQIENAEAAKYVSQAMNTFGLRSKDVETNLRNATRVVDLFAATANASQAEIGDVADAFRYSSAQAREAGVGIEDLTTAIAMLSNRGIEASVAGTSLRALFTRLVPSTEKAAGAFERLGLMTEDGKNKLFNAKGEFIGMSKAADLAAEGLKGMSQEQRISALHAAFGVAGMRAFSNVLAQGSTEFDKMKKAATEAGAAQKMTDAMTSGAKGAMEAFRSTLETTAIVLGSVLLPAFTSVLKTLNSFVAFLGEHEGVTIALVAAIGGLAATIWLVHAATKAWVAISTLGSVAFIGLGTSATVADKMMRLTIIGALAGLVIALVLAYQKSETFRDIVKGVFEKVQDAAVVLKDVFEDSMENMRTVIDAVAPVITGAFEAIRSLFNWFRDNSGTIWSGVQTALIVPINLIKGAVWLAEGAFGAVKTIFNWFKDNAGGIWGGIKTVMDAPLDGIKLLINGVDKAADAVKTGFNWIKDNAGTLWGAVKTAMTLPLEGIEALIRGVRNVANGVKDGFGWFRDEAGGVWSTVKGAVTEPIDGIKGLFNRLGDAVDLVKSAFAWFREHDGIFGKVWAAAKGPLEALRGAFDKVLDVINAIKGAIQWLIDKIPSIPKVNVPDWVPGAGSEFGKNPPPVFPGTPPGSPSVPGVSAIDGVTPKLWDEAALGRQMGLYVSSGLRLGDPGDHGRGHAIDMSGSTDAMSAFASAVYGRSGLKDVIYGYHPYWQDNGGMVHTWVNNEKLRDDHLDHVHVSAFDNGGWLAPKSKTLAINNTNKWEPVGPPGAGRGVTNVYVQGSIVTESQLLQMIAKATEQKHRENPYLASKGLVLSH